VQDAGHPRAVLALIAGERLAQDQPSGIRILEHPVEVPPRDRAQAFAAAIALVLSLVELAPERFAGRAMAAR